MYSNEQNKEFGKATATWLKNIDGKNFDPSEPGIIESLRDVLRFHEYRYYIINDPLVSDFEYDKLFKALEAIEKANPSLISADSPTQRVAKDLNKDFAKVQHLVPMLSLDNSYNEEDLRDFDRRARELTGTDSIEYCVEPKFDGASISLIYENDMLARGATRGDGVTGDDISTNIKQVRSVPLSAKFSKYNLQQVEIRGEVLINKEKFKQFNESLMEQGLPPLANPRNAASGTLRIKDPREVGKRNLEAFVYHLSDYTLLPGKETPAQLKTHAGALELLWELGFRSPQKEKKVLKGIEAIIKYCMDFEAGRDDLPYEIDGMVIKVNDTELQDRMGMTTHHPRWAMAFKFKARQATSTLLNVEFQVGRTGSITPVAKIEPVPIGGVTVSSISLFNEDVIQEKDLLIGDKVLVERAGDVIPYIVKSLADARTGKETPILFPKNCPVCGDPLYKPEAEAVWRCVNINCAAQVVERIIHFVSKDAMDIRGFGEANIRKFFNLDLLKDIPGIYTLDFDAIGKMEGFGARSIEKMKEAIEASKQQPLHRLIFGLGIRYVGETTAKTLARTVKTVFDFQNYQLEELQALEDVGPKVAGSINEFFANEDNLNMLRQLEALGITLTNTGSQKTDGGSMEGLTFLFTGTLPTLKRSDAESMAEAQGGKILSGVSSKLNYLVAGEAAGSKLEKAKKINSIKIISEEEFLSLLSKS